MSSKSLYVWAEILTLFRRIAKLQESCAGAECNVHIFIEAESFLKSSRCDFTILFGENFQFETRKFFTTIMKMKSWNHEMDENSNTTSGKILPQYAMWHSNMYFSRQFCMYSICYNDIWKSMKHLYLLLWVLKIGRIGQ